MFICVAPYCDETEGAVKNFVKLLQWNWRCIYMLFGLVYSLLYDFVFPSHLVILLKYSFQSIKIRRYYIFKAMPEDFAACISLDANLVM